MARVSATAQMRKGRSLCRISLRCSRGAIYLVIQASRQGHISRGKTFARIRVKACVKPADADGCSSGTNTGTATAVAIFINMVYVMTPAMSPPSLSVMTEAAVAVGQIRHIISDSSTVRASPSGSSRAARAVREKVPVCSRISHHCQRCGLSCFGSILQKVR